MSKMQGDMRVTNNAPVSLLYCSQWIALSADEFCPCLLCVRIANHPNFTLSLILLGLPSPAPQSHNYPP